jgi:hypothetical protein
VHNRLETTIQGQNDPRAAIRHLLQAADPIPNFTQLPVGLNIQDFFMEFLVRRGRRHGLVLREECATVIEKKCHWNAEKILFAMKDATLERTKEIKALSAFTRITGIYGQFDLLSKDAIQNTEKLLVAAFERPKLTFQRRSMEDYIKDPALLSADFSRLNSGGNQSIHIPEMIYGFLTTQFDFERFRKVRSDCVRLDESLEFLIQQNKDQFIQDLFPQRENPGKRFNTQKWLLEHMMSIQTENEELLEILRRAFLESNPLRKLSQITNGIAQVNKYLLSELPPTAELGADEYLPVMIAYFFMANPKYIVSNYVFIHDFCVSPAYGALFQNSLVQPRSVLRIIMEKLPKFQPAKLFRNKED